MCWRPRRSIFFFFFGQKGGLVLQKEVFQLRQIVNFCNCFVSLGLEP